MYIHIKYIYIYIHKRQVAPFANLVEAAGGKTSDAVTGMSCLDIKITAVDQVFAL